MCALIKVSRDRLAREEQRAGIVSWVYPTCLPQHFSLCCTMSSQRGFNPVSLEHSPNVLTTFLVTSHKTHLHSATQKHACWPWLFIVENTNCVIRLIIFCDERIIRPKRLQRLSNGTDVCLYGNDWLHPCTIFNSVSAYSNLIKHYQMELTRSHQFVIVQMNSKHNLPLWAS